MLSELAGFSRVVRRTLLDSLEVFPPMAGFAVLLCEPVITGLVSGWELQRDLVLF